jgi:hypothetical protein
VYLNKTSHKGPGRVSRMTKFQAERATARVRAGEGATQVAAEYGVSVETLRRVIKGQVTRLRDGLWERTAA